MCKALFTVVNDQLININNLFTKGFIVVCVSCHLIENDFWLEDFLKGSWINRLLI